MACAGPLVCVCVCGGSIDRRSGQHSLIWNITFLSQALSVCCDEPRDPMVFDPEPTTSRAGESFPTRTGCRR